MLLNIIQKSMGEYVRYDKLLDIIEKEKCTGKKIILTGGSFDLVHEGHQYLFRKARNLGDILIVNVVNDMRVKKYKGEKRPIRGEIERAILVSGMEGVDYSTVHPSVDSGPTIELAIMIKPDIVVQGKKKWKEQNKKHLKKLLGYDVKFESIRRSPFKISTSSLIEKIIKIYK